MSESCVDPRYPATYHVSPQWRVTGDGGLDTIGEKSGVRVPLARASLRLLELAGGSLAGAARLKPGKPLTKLAARVEPGGRFYHGPMAVGGGNDVLPDFSWPGRRNHPRAATGGRVKS